MQTALHIVNLVTELRQEIVGGTVVNTEFYKKERAAYFFIRNTGALWALGFLYHPHGSGSFLVPASKIKIDTKEKPWPIFDLAESQVISVDQPVLDRIFSITVRRSDTEQRIVFEALGPNGNIWLLDSHSRKQATLRNRDYSSGEPYETMPLQDRLDPFALTEPQLHSGIAHSLSGGVSFVNWIEKHVAGFTRTMAKEVAKRAGVSLDGDSPVDPARLEAAADAIRDLASRFRQTGTGYIYDTPAGCEAYPFKLSSIDDQPEKCKTLSFATMDLAARKQSAVEQVDEKKSGLQVVQSAIRKLERRIENVKKDIAEAADFEKYKRIGDLLHTNFTKLKRGMSSITVEDTLSHSHDKITIPLDSALSPKQNVETFFKRHRKGKEGLELLQRRLQISESELVELKQMVTELDSNFESASEKYRSEIAALTPRESTPDKVLPRLPYREYTLSTGLTIFVGRDGADNDRTTFDFAKPHELWFHTQQCPGSHVVIKFPNKSFEPSKAEIEETASIAAFFSKAKNDSLVPVIYAERRYVRKPRNAKPGLVMVEREKSIMVAPRKPK